MAILGAEGQQVYVRDLTLHQIKGFQSVPVVFPMDKGRQGGWFVLLGDNGTGKSTMLQAIGLALAGPQYASVLLPYPEGWVAKNTKYGECELTIQARRNAGRPVKVQFLVAREPQELPEVGYITRPSVVFPRVTKATAAIYDTKAPGFLLAGYGPFRHISATGRSTLVDSSARNEPFDNLFKPTPLVDCEEWLKDLDYAASDESRPKERPVLRERFEAVKMVINQLLPKPYQLDKVSSKGVSFTGPGQAALTLSQLSDGYRTMFGLAVDLLRRVVERSKEGEVIFERDSDNRWRVTMPGVVLLDEIEAHLHPRWQRQVGHYLQETFPNTQFIVATHSPFVVQAATPGGILVFSRKRRGEVEVDTSIESLRGWRAEQILNSPAFGLESTRDPETEQIIKEHGALQAKVEAGIPLNKKEQARLEALDSLLIGLLPDVMPKDMVSVPLPKSGGHTGT